MQKKNGEAARAFQGICLGGNRWPKKAAGHEARPEFSQLRPDEALAVERHEELESAGERQRGRGLGFWFP